MLVKTDAREKLRQIETAAEWLEGQGLRVRNTRYDAARRTLEKGVQAEELDPTDMVQYQWAGQELDDFLLVHQFLSDAAGAPINVLAKTLKGCVAAAQEKAGGGISGRNFVFELVTASRFAMLGFDVRFEGDADCIVQAGNFDVFIECKRSIGENADAGLGTAFRQIRKRCADGRPERSFGIAAVCYTHLIAKDALDNGPLIAPLSLVSQQMFETSAGLDFSPYQRYCPPGLGVISHFTVPFWELNDMNLTFLRRTNLHRLVPKEHPAVLELKKLWRNPELTIAVS